MTKSYFQKVAALWMFFWELSAIYFTAILQGGYSESSFTQLFRFITALIFSWVQRNRGTIAVFFSTMECTSYSKLMTTQFFRHGIMLLTFLWSLKTVRFYKKLAQRFVKL